MYTATCRCGQLPYAAAGDPRFHAFCHCSDCRAATGQPFVEALFFDASTVQRQGEAKTRHFVSARGNATYRDACAVCGDVLADRSDGFPDLIGILVGYFQPKVESQPQFHMWTASAVATLAGDDPLSKYEHGPRLAGVAT